MPKIIKLLPILFLILAFGCMHKDDSANQESPVPQGSVEDSSSQSSQLSNEQDAKSQEDKKIVANQQTLKKEDLAISGTGIYYQMTQDQLQKINSHTKPDVKVMDDFIEYDYHDGLLVYLSTYGKSDGDVQYVVSNIVVESDKYKTHRGITVGMNKEQIIENYGEYDSEYQEGGYRYIYYNCNSSCSLSFKLKEDKIEQFFITTNM